MSRPIPERRSSLTSSLSTDGCTMTNSQQAQLQEDSVPDADEPGDRQPTQNKKDRRCCCSCIPDTYVTEIKALFHLAWPISLTSLTLFIPWTFSLIFCGQLGTTELNSVALASSFIFVTGTLIGFGVSSACDTYFSQYNGSVNRHKLGVVLQKSLLILLLTAVPCVALHLNGEACLRLVGQDPEFSRLAGRYMLICMPYTVCFCAAAPIFRFMQCQNVVYPGLVISCGNMVLNVLLHYCFINVAKMGIESSAIAHSITTSLVLIVVILYVRYSGLLKDTWQGWSLECLEEWGGFFKLGLLGTIVISVDVMCFEVGLLLSGLLSETDLAAQVVLFQLNAGLSFALIGVGVASGVRMGNLLGADNKESAKRATKVSVIAAGLIGVTAGVLLVGLKSYLPMIYTSNRDTINLASKVAPVSAVRILFTTISFTVEGILRGCGRQAIDAAIVLSGHTLSLAIGIPLMFKTFLGITGLWIGYSTGMCLEAIVGTLVMVTTDWDFQVQRALKRTKSIPDKKEHSTEQPETVESFDSAVELQDRPISDCPPVSTHPSLTDQRLEEEPISVSMATILKRLCALIAVIIVLLIGVTVRLTLHIDRETNHFNSTNVYENTTVNTLSV